MQPATNTPWPLPTDLTKEFLKLAVRNGFEILPLMLVSKKFNEIVTTELVNCFKELRISGVFHEERFAFLDQVDATPKQQYLTFKKATAPSLTLTQIKKYDRVASCLLQLPFLRRLEWYMAFKDEGGVPLKLDGLENTKPGMVIVLGNALASSIPGKVQANAFISFNACKFEGLAYNSVRGTNLPINQRFFILFQGCQFTFARTALGLTKLSSDSMVTFGDAGTIWKHDDSNLNSTQLSTLLIQKLVVENVRTYQSIPYSLLAVPTLMEIEWFVVEHTDGTKILYLEGLHRAKPGMKIKIHDADIPVIPTNLQVRATLKFTKCTFNERPEKSISCSLVPTEPQFTVEFNNCRFDQPLPLNT